MTTVDADRLRYLRIVTEAYMSWRRGGVHLGIASTARVIGIPQPVENRRVIDLSVDEFTLIDRRFARLSSFDRAVLETEYNESGSVRQKARMFHHKGGETFSPDEYRASVANAEVVFYSALMPEIEWWERAKPMRRRA